jgi:hypothetical protein
MRPLVLVHIAILSGLISIKEALIPVQIFFVKFKSKGAVKAE